MGRLDLRLVLADDVEGRAVRRRADRERQAGQDRDAHVEAEQLDRDLSLVVIHADRAVVVTVADLEVERVGGERPLAGDLQALRLPDRRGDDLDLLAADVAALAGVGIERRDRDPRSAEAGGPQGLVGQPDRRQDFLLREMLGDFL